MFEDKIQDRVFLRNVIVGLSSFLYDILYIDDIDKNGELVRKRIPFFYSITGEEQFIQDFFLNRDKYCDVLSPKIEGNINTIPSGVFSLQSATISQQKIHGGYIRAKFNKIEDTDFGKEIKQVSARTDMVPLEMSFNIEIKCSSDLERFAIFQEIIHRFYKVKKFYIKFKGFNKLPVLVGFPESMDISKSFDFRYPENEKRPTMSLGLESIGWMPVPDERTERYAEEKIDDFTFRLKINTEPDDSDNDNDDDVNDEFKI